MQKIEGHKLSSVRPSTHPSIHPHNKLDASSIPLKIQIHQNPTDFSWCRASAGPQKRGRGVESVALKAKNEPKQLMNYSKPTFKKSRYQVF